MCPHLRNNRDRFRLASATAAVAVLILVLLCAPVPAWAHSALDSSSPQNGAQLESMPKHIELTFTADVRDAGASIILVDAHGNDWITGPALVTGSAVSASVKPSAPDGRYEARWRIVSADGAPQTGIIRFSIGEAAADPNPLHIVLTAQDASWIRSVLVIVFGGLIAYIAYGLITVYGGRDARSGSSHAGQG